MPQDLQNRQQDIDDALYYLLLSLYDYAQTQQDVLCFHYFMDKLTLCGCMQNSEQWKIGNRPKFVLQLSKIIHIPTGCHAITFERFLNS